MADWRKMAMAAILSDGKVDEAEVKILQRDLKGAEGKIDEEGLKFLIELRAAAHKKAKAASEEVSEAFEKFFYKVITDTVVKESKIDDTGAEWLRTNLYPGKKIEDRDWEFLTNLNKKAKTKSSGFEKLYSDFETARAKASKK